VVTSKSVRTVHMETG